MKYANITNAITDLVYVAAIALAGLLFLYTLQLDNAMTLAPAWYTAMAGGSPSTLFSTITRSETALPFSLPALRIFSGSVLGLLIISMAASKTTMNLGFRRPIGRIVKRLEDVLASDLGTTTGKGHITRLEELVDHLTVSRLEAQQVIEKIADGNLDEPMSFSRPDAFSNALATMQNKLKALSVEERRQVWVNQNLAQVEEILKEQSTRKALAEKLISLICKKINAPVGVLYSYQEHDGEGNFSPESHYGYFAKDKMPRCIAAGHGQLGELAISKKASLLSDVPSRYLVIHSGLGSSNASHIAIIPMLFKDNLYGALELASFKTFEPHEIQWLEKVGQSVAAQFFNQNVTESAKKQLEVLAEKQSRELVKIHALQRETYSQLEAKLAEADAERQKNEAILEGCVDGVVTFDENGKIIFSNKAMQELIGMTRERLKNSDIQQIMPIAIREGMEGPAPYYLSGSTEKAIAVRTEASFSTATGDTVDVLMTSTQIMIKEHSMFTFFIQKISVDLF